MNDDTTLNLQNMNLGMGPLYSKKDKFINMDGPSEMDNGVCRYSRTTDTV